jgi:hypothetical protein
VGEGKVAPPLPEMKRAADEDLRKLKLALLEREEAARAEPVLSATLV